MSVFLYYMNQIIPHIKKRWAKFMKIQYITWCQIRLTRRLSNDVQGNVMLLFKGSCQIFLLFQNSNSIRNKCMRSISGGNPSCIMNSYKLLHKRYEIKRIKDIFHSIYQYWTNLTNVSNTNLSSFEAKQNLVWEQTIWLFKRDKCSG